jgi:hypothetical protein
MSSTTPSPDRADLRTLAAEAVHGFQCHRCSEDGPCRACGGPDAEDHREGAAVLAAVLPEHRRMVLGEAAEAITDNVRNEDWTKQDRGGFYGVAPKMAYVAGHDKAADILRRLAAAAPPAGPSAPVPAENAPAVPEATPDDAPLDGEALALAEHFRHLDCGQVVDPVDLEDCGNMAEEVLRFLTARGWRAPAVPEADGRRAGQDDVLDPFRPCPIRCGWTQDWTEFDDEVGLRAARGQHLDRHSTYEIVVALDLVRAERNKAATDRDRLARELEHWRTVIVPELIEQRDRLGTDRDRLAYQVAQCQRVVERVRALHTALDGRCVECVEYCDCLDRVTELGDDVEVAASARMCNHGQVPWPCPTIAAVDALPDAGTDQTEDDHG